MRLRYGFGLLAALLMAVPAAVAGDIAFGRGEVRIETAGGVRLFHVELAETRAQQARGLMFRRSLAPDAGMLFLFREGDRPTMWMANTWLPLDMLFVAADGRIVHVFPNAVPQSRLTVSSPHAARMVLELNGGVARSLGIEPGDRLSWRRLDR